MNEREWMDFQEHQLTLRVRALRDYLATIPDVQLRWDVSWHLAECFEILRRMSEPADPMPDGSLRLPFTVS